MKAGSEKAKPKKGRPTRYTLVVVKIICDRLSNGETLRSVCRDETLPPESTVRQWVLDDRNGFSAQYTRARDLGLDAMADEMLDVADNASNDYMEREEPNNPGYQLNGENVQRSRLRIDARKWYLCKLAPKRYGDRQQLEVSGKDGGPIQTINSEMTPQEAAAAYADTLNSNKG